MSANENSQERSEVVSDWGDPTENVRLRIEKEDLKMDATAPATQAVGVLNTLSLAAVAAGAVVGPAMTMKMAPLDSSADVLVVVILAQVALLAGVAWFLFMRTPRV